MREENLTWYLNKQINVKLDQHHQCQTGSSSSLTAYGRQDTLVTLHFWNLV